MAQLVDSDTTAIAVDNYHSYVVVFKSNDSSALASLLMQLPAIVESDDIGLSQNHINSLYAIRKELFGY